jgi:UDP-N-acetylmuramate dehydrogenase
MELPQNVPLAPYTTWKVGGAAEYLGKPEDVDQLCRMLQWAKECGHPVWVLGRGSNTLIADEGLPGLTLLIRDTFNQLQYDPESGLIRAGAGVSLPKLCKFAASLGWGGYEFLIGIPGTVGGGLFMNCGYKKGDSRDMAHLCKTVTLLQPDYRLEEIAYSQLQPAYRYSRLHDSEPEEGWSHPLIVEGGFVNIGQSDPKEIRAATSEHLRMRKATQPLTMPTAGSVFVTEDGTPAAIYIDQAGLKGYQIGGARISPKHANWIENTGTATATDILELMKHVQKVVAEEFGISLKSEVRMLPGAREN